MRRNKPLHSSGVRWFLDVNKLYLPPPNEWGRSLLQAKPMTVPDVQDAETTGAEAPIETLGVVMYIEEKPGLARHARIGRVKFSRSRRTVYYCGRKLQSLNGSGYKANYFNVDTGLEYWISGCKKNGNDTLYTAIIEIDEDAREEY